MSRGVIVRVVFVRGIFPGAYVRGYMSGGICPGLFVLLPYYLYTSEIL